MERVYRSFPLVTYAVNEFAEQAVGPGYYIKGDNPRPVEAVERFADQVNLDQLLIRTARELAITGNSFWERRFDRLNKDSKDPYRLISHGNLVEVAIHPYTAMKVVPDPFTGADPPAGYVQIIFAKTVKFAPEQIAHFRFNISGGAVGSDFYGTGLLQPVLDYVDGLQEIHQYMRIIMRRYAAPKVHWKLGSDQFPAKPEDVKTLQADLKTIKPDEDFVSSYLVQGEVLEPDLRARFEEYVQQYTLTTMSGLENPSLILSMSAARVSDASANAMMDAWNRKVNAVQSVIKQLLQDLIFKPIVRQTFNGNLIALSNNVRNLVPGIWEGLQIRFKELPKTLSALQALWAKRVVKHNIRVNKPNDSTNVMLVKSVNQLPDGILRSHCYSHASVNSF